MMNTPRFPCRARSLLVLGICLLILGAVPTRPARAATIPQSVDNTLSEFTLGTFQRTSLGAQRVSSPPPGTQPKVTDETGAVQLVPIGLLKTWFNSPFLLPEKLTDIGAVAIGAHIFVIGGTATVNNVPAKSAHVYSVTIDPTTGAPLASWGSEPDLPAIQTSDQFTLPVAGRAVPAVAAVQTGLDSGYIYVMGGSVRPPNSPDSISSYGVTIGTVANGHITGWLPDDLRLRIPAADPLLIGQVGVQSASALSFLTGSKRYLYLLGGLQRYREDTTVEAASNQVFYAQVGSGGQLVKPSNGQPGWDTLAPIPVSDPGTMGLWDATAVADHFDIGGGISVGGDVLYLVGGQLRPDNPGPVAYNSKVYRALINSSTGALTWTSAAGPNQWEGTMPEARVGLAGVQFSGNLYVTGGRPISGNAPAEPQKAVLTSYVEDDLKLPTFGTGPDSSNFLRNADALPLPRARHGSVVVPATPTEAEPNAAFVYVIAGQGDKNDGDTRDDQGSDTMIYGKIGSSEDRSQTGFAPSGWFYSAPHSTVFQGAQVQEINWTTVITRTGPGMDIAMEYRISTASDCNAANAFTGAGTEWRSLDGSPSDGFFSVNSANSVNLGAGLVASCFQYRAKLSTGDPFSTPALLNVSIQVTVPGGPDLKVLSINDTRSVDGKNSLTGLQITIINENTAANWPTLPADVETKGSFYVDLFVYGPDDGTPTPPVLPLTSTNLQRSKAYAQVNKSVMGIGTQLTLTRWCPPAVKWQQCQPVDILSLFPKPGQYTIYVAVDSFNYVSETPQNPAEQNNVLSKVIQVPRTSRSMHLPLIKR